LMTGRDCDELRKARVITHLMTGRDCDELRMAWVMTYLLPVIAT